MTPQDVANVAAQAGFSGQGLVYAIAVSFAEDGSHDPNANYRNYATGEDSRGLWQINVQDGAHPQLANVNLYDPLINAQWAYQISNGGTNWNAWSTWTNGDYQNYLSQAQQLAAAASGMGTATPVNPPAGSSVPSNQPPSNQQTPNNAAAILTAGAWAIGLVLAYELAESL